MEKVMDYFHIKLNPKEQIGSHQHSCWELSFVISGHGMRTIGNSTEPFTEGDLVLVPPDMPHCWSFSFDRNEIENITLIFQEPCLHLISNALPGMSTAISTFCGNEYAMSFSGKTKDNIIDTLTGIANESPEMRIVSLLRLIVTIVESKHKSIVGVRPKSLSEHRLEQIEIYIKCNYNRNISIDSIARHVGMNRSSVCSFYRKHTGRTLVTLINDCRIEAAKNLLKNDNLSIKQVCFESGFNDLPYFCRLFRKREGITPGRYRTYATHLV